MKYLTIFVVSDSVGETGENAVKAVVSQFRPNFEKVNIRRFPHINDLRTLKKLSKSRKIKKQQLFLRL